MDILKKIWPTTFKVKEHNVISLIVQLIIFVVLVAIIGVVIGILAAIPVVGIIASAVGGLLGLYNIIGIRFFHRSQLIRYHHSLFLF